GRRRLPRRRRVSPRRPGATDERESPRFEGHAGEGGRRPRSVRSPGGLSEFGEGCRPGGGPSPRADAPPSSSSLAFGQPTRARCRLSGFVGFPFSPNFGAASARTLNRHGGSSIRRRPHG